MWTLNFGHIVVHKKRINERESYIFVKWLCANKRNKSMRDLIFGRMVVHKKRINERGPYNLVEWPFANKKLINQ